MAGSSLAPSFLVAMPQLRDPNFKRSVVMVVNHDDEGTFGVILNRDTEISARGLCASLELEWCGAPGKGIRWGGPVQPQTGWLVFDDDAALGGHEDVKELAGGVHFAGSFDVLRDVVNHPPEDLHLLLGYAGWGPGQLENELAEGAWIVAPVSREVVFEVHTSVMWDHVLRSLGIEPSTLVATRGVH